jgi:hypothetical protein
VFKILNVITSNFATDQVYFSRPENEVSKYRADKLFMYSTCETIVYKSGCETGQCHFKYIIPLNSSAYFIAYIVSCINNHYSFIIPDEDFRTIKYYFDFTRIQFYKQSEISKTYLYIYKSNQGNINKNVCRSFLFLSVLRYITLHKLQVHTWLLC